MPTQEVLMLPQTSIPLNAEALRCEVIPRTPVFDALLLVMWVILGMTLIGAVVSMIRLHFVSKFRRKMLNEVSALSKKLLNEDQGKTNNYLLPYSWYEDQPDFDDMMHAFWIWPVDRMIEEPLTQYVARKAQSPKE